MFKNLANIVSLAGVLPLCILFDADGYQYLLPLIVYNNVMDDLDGILAGKLNIRSSFGALMDNVCDAISHSIIMMSVGMHYFHELEAEGSRFSFIGAIGIVTCLIAISAIIIRSVSRIDSTAFAGMGSATNELIRHVFFILILERIFGFNAMPYIIVACVLHSMSMLIPFKMTYLIRSLTKSATAISMVNVALLVALLVPLAAPFIAASFFLTYLTSFAAGAIPWLRKTETPA